MDKDKKTIGHSPTSETQNTVVHTYAEDMAEVIGSDTAGLVKKIIHGAEEQEQEKKIVSPESKKNRFFMLAGILLVLAALGTFSFFFFKNTNGTVPIEKPFTPLVFSDKSAYFEIAGLNKDEIAQTVLNEVNSTKVQAGGLEGIYLTENKQEIGLRRFISLIKSSFIPGDNTLFVNDNFMMGVVNSNTPGFFILLKVRSTADIFDSLRAWEPNLLADLHGFLGLSISSDTNYLFTQNFKDGIVENKNARILYDKNGNVVLMYIFADDNSVVITDSQSAAHEVMLRLAYSQVQQ